MIKYSKKKKKKKIGCLLNTPFMIKLDMYSDLVLDSSSSSSPDFRLTCRYRGQHPHSVGPLPGSCLAASMAYLTPDLQVCLSWGSIAESFHSVIPLCQLLPCHLGPPMLMLSINLYATGWLDCTIEAFHMSIPAEPSLLQDEVRVPNAKLRK